MWIRMLKDNPVVGWRAGQIMQPEFEPLARELIDAGEAEEAEPPPEPEFSREVPKIKVAGTGTVTPKRE